MTVRYVDSMGPSTVVGEKGWSAGSIVAAGGPNSQNYLQAGQNVTPMHKINPVTAAGYSQVIVGARVMMASALSGTWAWIRLTGDGNSVLHVDVRWNGANFIITRNGTTLGTGTFVPAFNVWYYLELKVTISDTVGVAELRVNGTVDITLTSQDTRNAGSAAAVDYVGFSIGNTTSQNLRWCDVYVIDWSTSPNTTYLGDCRVRPYKANAAGSTTQWTPLSSTNVSNVDDATSSDEDTTYNYDSTAGHIDLYAMEDLPDSATIVAVQHSYRYRKDNAGSRSVRGRIRTNSTEYTGSTISAADTYVTQVEPPREVNPQTSAGWTTAEVNALETGIELVS